MEFEDELEKQYAPSQWSRYAKSDEVLRDFISETVRGSYIARNMIPGSFDVSYGQSENQKVDIFGENKLPKEAPVFVFVHGGYWISGRNNEQQIVLHTFSRKDSSFPVRPLYEAGILCIIMGYDLITETFLLPELVTQIQCGIKFVLEFAENRGSRGVYFCGHSAGAHLISMALSSDPPQEEHYKLIKGLVFFSGIYNLVPLLKTSNARAAYITKDIAEFYSPMKAIATFKNNIKHTIHIWLAVAEHDSLAFQKQSEEYAEALQAMGVESVQYFCFCKGLDHFTLVQSLYDKDYFFSKKLVDFIKAKNLNLKHEEVKNKKKTVRKSFDILKNADNVKSVEHLKSPDYLKHPENKKSADKVGDKEYKENVTITNNDDSKDTKSKENEDGSKNFEKLGNKKVLTQSAEKIDMKNTCCAMETAANKEIAENEDNRMEVTESEAGDSKDKEKEFNEDKNSEQDSVEDGVNEKLAEIDINKKQTTEFEVSVDMARISKVDNEAETTKVDGEAELMVIKGKDKGEASEGQVSDKIATREENSNETGNGKVGGSQKASEYELKLKDMQSSTPQKVTSDGENNQKMAIGSDAEKE